MRRGNGSSVLLAGSAYFGAVFCVGFLLGTIRTLWLAPRYGESAAVLLELPVILTASWFLCRWAVRRWRVPPAPAPRLAMGGLAFGLLMLTELLLATVIFGQTTTEWLADRGTPVGALGLAGQIVFGLLPLFQVWKNGTGVVR